MLNPLHSLKRWLEVFCFRLLKKSKIFWYWYSRFLCELAFDLEIVDISQEEIKEKYLKKLLFANSKLPKDLRNAKP